ncbi:MarR family winged helix-turn-helix transcriptional regulator [Paenibacillus lentus]|uniref:MarR family transcriptional regulator n=1 Tax=Paenibacillus lentus TaxID=1338368 RepID=A0A3Q8S7C5_9BACL|nr:MarR family transcriptional regulator [Paenibacillus lentus]AZK48882.1 MarR family transcriptional regulator [Paenibacillus lentus]
MGDDPVAQRLLEAVHRFRRAGLHKMAIDGWNNSEIKMLMCIQWGCVQDERGSSVSSLSSMMEVTSPTITQLIKSLERGGLVTRYNDQEDRRVVRVKLTEKGEAVTRLAKEDLARRFKNLYEHLGAEKSEQLASLLEQVYDYLDASMSEKHEINGESGDDGR